MGMVKRNLLGNWYGGDARPFVREEFSLADGERTEQGLTVDS